MSDFHISPSEKALIFIQYSLFRKKKTPVNKSLLLIDQEPRKIRYIYKLLLFDEMKDKIERWERITFRKPPDDFR